MKELGQNRTNAKAQQERANPRQRHANDVLQKGRNVRIPTVTGCSVANDHTTN